MSPAPGYIELKKELIRLVDTKVFRDVGNISVRELLALVAVSDIVISADTGVAHIANAIGTRTVTIFGPTDPLRFWYGVDGSRSLSVPNSCCDGEHHTVCQKNKIIIPGICMLDVSKEYVEIEVEKVFGIAISDSNLRRVRIDSEFSI